MNNMCGRYSLIVTDDLGTRFRVHEPLMGLRSRFNVTPGQEMPIVHNGADCHMSLMVWGLVPSWAKDPAIGRRLINARAESVAEKPAFRASFKRKRCIVPTSGFYEWKAEKGEKIPFYYHLPGNTQFGFAGLYDVWHPPEGEEVRTYTIITTDSNELVAGVHDRMPAILREEDEAVWLDPDAALPELMQALEPFPVERMEGYRVSTLVNNPENDSEDLIAPLTTAHRWW